MYSFSSSLSDLPMQKADPARLHHAQEQALLFDVVILPDQQFQKRPSKSAAEAAQFLVRFIAVEDRVDRVQRPALVQNDAVIEQTVSIKGHPSIVQIIQEMLGGGDAALFLA